MAWRNKDGSVMRDENGEALWRPTMKDGTYAEPYRLKPFGSLEVVDRETDEFVECRPGTCPKGERIPSVSRLPSDDRARVLVDSPHAGKLINRAPFYWVSLHWYWFVLLIISHSYRSHQTHPLLGFSLFPYYT